jgi:hypothetical protein
VAAGKVLNHFSNDSRVCARQRFGDDRMPETTTITNKILCMTIALRMSESSILTNLHFDIYFLQYSQALGLEGWD